MPEISVIIPTYNRRNLVAEACRTVLRQTSPDFEVIVVDDGSTDDTALVIEQICDSRVKYIHKPNGGQSSARNVGLAAASGRYVAFLDADDLWPPDFLETVTAQLRANDGYGAAYGLVIELLPDGTKRLLGTPESCRSGWITKYFFGGYPCLFPSAILFRRSVWNNVFWDEAITRGTDFDVFLRLSTKTRFLFVSDVFIIKRSLPDSLGNIADPLGPVYAALSLERFYRHLGGDNYVSRAAAQRKISHLYRKAARISHSFGDKRTAVSFLSKAIRHYPLDVRLYYGLLKVALSKAADVAPAWDIPRSLPRDITASTRT
ncbi:MAG: glycosyltransferase family 2 protein [Planctomycetota bacterium]|jgi:glycosyltransferase involved in cell wall biosynthesis